MYDELVKRLRNRRICIQQSGSLDDFPLLREAADAIEELQKRVPKSGVWQEEESGYDDVYYECSVCGAGICTIEGDPVDNAWSYCPECGAKMTGIERLPEPPEEE